MSITARDYKPFYDYSKIEIGVQSYFVGVDAAVFCQPPGEPALDAAQSVIDAWNDRGNWTPGAGQVAVMTDFEANVFQSARPRVGIDFNNVRPHHLNAQAIVDPNNMLRATLYTGELRLGIVTGANYTAHVDLRSYVAALAVEICPPIPDTTVNSTVGVNQFLTHHLFCLLQDNGQDTTITPQEGYYISQLSYAVIFGWRRDKLPA